MKYDDASWHYGGDFPSELSESAGATHIGMFLAWALHRNLGGDIHKSDFAEDYQLLLNRKITPAKYLIKICDEKFTDEDLNEEGNNFAQAYYEKERGGYVTDYLKIVGGNLPSLYHVPDSWDTFDLICPVLDEQLKQWRGGA